MFYIVWVIYEERGEYRFWAAIYDFEQVYKQQRDFLHAFDLKLN